jgi:hypothetical protein
MGRVPAARQGGQPDHCLSEQQRGPGDGLLLYDSGASKIAEYAPDGIASNLCVTEPSKGAGLVLATCTGNANQQFKATEEESGATWTNQATGDIVTDPAGLRSQLTGVPAPEALTGADEWTFQG